MNIMNAKPTIMVVDDDQHLQDSMSRYLSRKGYSVLVASNGESAIRTVKKAQRLNKKIDVVLTDVLMPDMDGIELCIQLRAHFPEIHIIVMTGGGAVGQENITKIVKSLGIDTVLPKPFTLEVLKERLDTL